MQNRRNEGTEPAAVPPAAGKRKTVIRIIVLAAAAALLIGAGLGIGLYLAGRTPAPDAPDESPLPDTPEVSAPDQAEDPSSADAVSPAGPSASEPEAEPSEGNEPDPTGNETDEPSTPAAPSEPDEASRQGTESPDQGAPDEPGESKEPNESNAPDEPDDPVESDDPDPEGPYVAVTGARAETLAGPVLPETAKYPAGNGEVPEDLLKQIFKDAAERTEFAKKADAQAEFRKTTLRKLLASGKNPENRVYSPVSAYLCFSMLAECADGETQNQILNLLGAADTETLREQATALWRSNYVDDGRSLCLPGTSLWMDANCVYNGDLTERIAEAYYASSFRGVVGSEEYDRTLHDWLNEQTGGLLADSVNDIRFSPNTVLGLFSTLLYQSGWKTAFENEKNETFHAPDGDLDCAFLSGTDECLTVSGNGFTGVRKELNQGAMWFFLPDKGKTTDDLLADDGFLNLLAGGSVEGKTRNVEIHVPKFDVSSKTDLIPELQALGVTDCFDDSKADFSPLVRDGGAYVSFAEHGARVSIDKNGVTGAAFTAVIIDRKGTPSPEVRMTFDRPFLFLVVSGEGTPLFAGTVANPS